MQPSRKSPSPSEPSSSQSYSSKEPTPGPSNSLQSPIDSAEAAIDVVLESLISNIQEMLPDLGSGFLKVSPIIYCHLDTHFIIFFRDAWSTTRWTKRL
jgi:hypothetical protein